VHCAAVAKINEDLDWYSILQVDATADDTVIRKQYDKLANWLKPDKNTLSGAEVALKLVSEASEILCDHTKRSLYDIKR
jgi:DnaJ-class molecular chaperone